MSDEKRLITAREMNEVLAEPHAMPHARPIAGMMAMKKKSKAGEDNDSGGDDDNFKPTEVSDDITLNPNKTLAHIAGTDEVWDYKFDPYLGDCNWTELIDGTPCHCLVTLTEVDNWMFGFTQQTYTPPPGIRLIIHKGVKRSPEKNKGNKIKFGHRFNQADVSVYIHRRSFRVELSKQYQEFATLADGAKRGGLAEIGFPVDWDEVPYDV
jgi:hypothetical protein